MKPKGMRQQYAERLEGQQRWIEECGGDLDGYLRRYKELAIKYNRPTPDPKHIQAIFSEDQRELQRIQRRHDEVCRPTTALD